MPLRSSTTRAAASSTRRPKQTAPRLKATPISSLRDAPERPGVLVAIMALRSMPISRLRRHRHETRSDQPIAGGARNYLVTFRAEMHCVKEKIFRSRGPQNVSKIQHRVILASAPLLE